MAGDFIAINLAWVLYYLLRIQSGWFAYTRHDLALPKMLLPMFVVYAFWLIVFLFYGLYRAWYQASHFDEFSTVVKAVTVGSVILFAVSTLLDPPESRNAIIYLILFYWAILVICLGASRSTLRLLQRRLFEMGIGTRPSLVVGTVSKAAELLKAIRSSRNIGFNIYGFVASGAFPVNGELNIPVLGTTAELLGIIEKNNIKEILVALDSSQHNTLVDIIAKAGLASTNTRVKIVPDLYDVISGQARISQVHGVPLIDVSPHLMQPWEEAMKRTIDIGVSLAILLVGLPVWLLLSLLIIVTSKGSVFYKQQRIGKNGRLFQIVKFRSMYDNAESAGPQWAQKNDPRVTPLGNFLRKTHLDEVPQLFNVLRGEMSLVGPRPERPFFVEQLEKDIPYYRRRLSVRPGITGWYQVKTDKYDENIEDVKQRVKYDFYYIENMSLRLDLKIIFSTAYVMLRGKGQA
ncbi:MAG TPA: sugar transferase [Candidatus Kapabacteria bacterium]|nr:sugar transferase [Candidatus Kapabacteria bacterium]